MGAARRALRQLVGEKVPLKFSVMLSVSNATVTSSEEHPFTRTFEREHSISSRDLLCTGFQKTFHGDRKVVMKPEHNFP
jgi:adenosine deaminase